MAENNSSAPLKTAEGAYPPLPEPRTFDKYGWGCFSDLQMRAYVDAARAQTPVAAEPMAYVLGDPRYADSSNVFMSHQFTPDGEHEDEWTPLYAVTATPALPATEDSSAGALAEVQAEPVMIYHGRCTIDCGEHGHHDVEMLKMIPAGANLYTAPQAQPADALDAAPAAGALLEALESMVDECESSDFDGAPSEASMIKARAAIAAYRDTPAAANAKPADALLLHALELACGHIDMDALRISHCKDAAAIDAAMAAAQEGGNAPAGKDGAA